MSKLNGNNLEHLLRGVRLDILTTNDAAMVSFRVKHKVVPLFSTERYAKKAYWGSGDVASHIL
jgi:hypothetical protein